MAVYFLIVLGFLMVGAAFSIMSGKWYKKDSDAQASGVIAGVLVMAAPLPIMFAFRIIADSF